MADLDAYCVDNLNFQEAEPLGVQVGTVLIPQSKLYDNLNFQEATLTVKVGLAVVISEGLDFQEAPTIGWGPKDLEFSEHLEEISFASAPVLAFTEPLETPDLHGVSLAFSSLQIVDPKDVLSVHSFVEGLAQLSVTEPLEDIEITETTSVLGSFAFNEPMSHMEFAGVTGRVGELDIEDPIDVIALTAVMPAIAQLAIVDPIDEVYFHLVETPITYVWKGVAMNVLNYAVSEYKNFNFNSVVYFNGVFLGLNSEGVFILGGENDLGQFIQSRIMSGTEDLGKGVITIPREAWMTYRSDGALQLDVKLNEYKDLFPLRFNGNGEQINEARAKLGRGIKAKLGPRFFTWDLKNVSGADFDLDELRILGDVIGRKKR